ncbi:hypothetical protein UW163_24155 (plasmid) [Ralstonia solanacearum]|nr:hypothetical protein UW163_24155 [Ralstonia solanacearum]
MLVARHVLERIARGLYFVGKIVFSTYRLEYRGDIPLMAGGVTEMLHGPVAARFIRLPQLRTRHTNFYAIFDNFVNAMDASAYLVLQPGRIERLADHQIFPFR